MAASRQMTDIEALRRGFELQTREGAFKRAYGKTRGDYLAEKRLAGVPDSKAKKDFAKLADAANEAERIEESARACALGRSFAIAQGW